MWNISIIREKKIIWYPVSSLPERNFIYALVYHKDVLGRHVGSLPAHPSGPSICISRTERVIARTKR